MKSSQKFQPLIHPPLLSVSMCFNNWYQRRFLHYNLTTQLFWREQLVSSQGLFKEKQSNRWKKDPSKHTNGWTNGSLHKWISFIWWNILLFYETIGLGWWTIGLDCWLSLISTLREWYCRLMSTLRDWCQPLSKPSSTFR